MTWQLALILFAALYAWANRFAGGGFGWEKLAHDHGGPLRGHSTLYGGLGATIGAAAIAYGLSPALAAPAAILGLLWGLCRSIDFINDSATPDSLDEIVAALARHASVAACAYFVERGFNLPGLCLYVLAWAVLATVTAVLYAAADRAASRAGRPIDKSLNTLVEVSQGLLLGAAFWAGLGGAATVGL